MGVSVRSVSVTLKADISDFQRKLAEAAAGSKAFGSSLGGSMSSIDKNLTSVNDKLSNLAATAITLGPALVPMFAGATVGVAALGTQLTFAAAGAGVAVLALSGVSDALKALDTYSGAPTQANLDALHAKLAELAPAGQSFVFFLDSLAPKLDALRATAEQGFLPGLQSGITSVMTQFPIVNSLVSNLATTLGDLAAKGGEALQSPFWTHFLQDFSRNAGVALQALAEGLGNVAHGLAGMFDAFIPVGDSMSQKLLQLSQEFAQWGQSLSSNTGFQEFVQYVERTGPEMLSTIASIAKALLAIAHAAAPVGTATLPVIRALADGLAAIADSPAGPAIIGAAVAISTLAKALALLKAVGLVGGASSAIKGVTAVAVEDAAAATAARSALTAGSWKWAGGATSAEVIGATGTGELAAGLGASAGAGIAGGVAVAGLAALYNGYSLASQGADRLSVAAKNLDSVFGSSTLNLRAQSASLHELSSQVNAYEQNQARLHQEMTSSWNPYTVVRDAAQIDFSPGDAAQQAQLAKAQIANGTLLRGLQDVRMAQAGATDANPLKGFTDNAGLLQQTADNLMKLGHTVPQIMEMFKTEGGTQELSDELTAYNQQVALAAAPSAALQTAIAGLDNKMIPTATAANNLQTALSGLLGPQLTNVQATDAWTTALRGLQSQLGSGSHTLLGNTNDAIKSRAAIDGLVGQYQAMITAGAGVGQSSAQFVESMRKQYYALLHTGVQAGISRSNMVAYLRSLGLTPHAISTLVTVKGADAATRAAKDLVARYNALPKSVRTELAANGIPANATADSLSKKYKNLSAQQVQTILRARDSASVVINGVRADLARLNGSTATVYVNTQASGLHSGVQINQAHGGVVDYYARGGLRENHRAQIAPAGAYRVWAEPETGGEGYVPLAPSKRPQSRPIAQEIVSRLGGGRVEWFANGGYRPARMPSGGYQDGGLRSEIAALRTEITALRSTSQGPQDVRVVNAQEVATGVRGVARNQVNQAASFATDIEDLNS